MTEITMNPLPLLACLALIAGAATAEPLIEFGSGKGKSQALQPDSGSASLAKVEYAEDYVRITGPSAWENRLAAQGLNIRTKADKEDYLELEIAGFAGTDSPRLTLVLKSADWSQSTYWEFDLSGIKEDEFTRVRAKTSLAQGNDEAQHQPFNPLKSRIGVIYIHTAATVGSTPWDVRLRAIHTSRPESYN